MTLDSPAWLILLPFAAIAGWWWRGLRLHEPLRALALVLVVLALTGPRSRWGDDGRDVWVLVDRSQSAAGAMARSLPEWEELVSRGRGRGDRLWFVDFGEGAVRRERGDPVFTGGDRATRVAAAVRYTLGEIDPSRPARLLLLSDGQTTEPLDGLAEALVRARVPLDVRFTAPATAPDFQVSDLRMPSVVEPGAGFLIEAAITSTASADASVPWELFRDGAPAGRGEVSVRNGEGRLRLTDRLVGAGTAGYELRIAGANDAHPENNHAAAWVLVGGRNRVLLVTAFPDDPLATVLREGGAVVDIVSPARGAQATIDPGRLASARAVVFHNVPAWSVNRAFLDALPFFVQAQGGGLLMVGGRASFAAGGFFESPVDEMLPVSMELRQDHRKLAVALSIVMDRSGSMAATAGGQTKMDLANAGAARAAQLLGESDLVAVHAVDSEPHEVLPLVRVMNNRQTIEKVVRRISVGGGGIYVYTGMKAGWAELQRAEVGQRHMVLFADAADAEEPGEYQALIDEMRADGATVSVIGLGTRQDADAAFLEDIAERGGGRMFFAADALTLPEVFAQETVTIARSAFIDEAVGVVPTPGWREIAAQPLDWLAEVDGYNLCYLRPDATAMALSKDDYSAPLVAAWQRGAGRVAAVTFPLGGDFSELAREWPRYRDFSRTLLRWLSGADTPPEIGLRTTVTGNRLRLALFLDPTAANLLSETVQRPPALVVASGADGAARPIPWQRIAPGEFEAAVDLPEGGWLRGAVQVGSHTLPFGPVGAVAQAEWLNLPERVAELRLLARQSGGVERLDLGEIWTAPLPPVAGGIQPWLLGAALLLLVADAFLTRLGILLTGWRPRTVENEF